MDRGADRRGESKQNGGFLFPIDWHIPCTRGVQPMKMYGHSWHLLERLYM